VGGKKPYELWAESIREIGILLLVFGPLETLPRSERTGRKDWLIAFAVAILGLLLIVKGVRMESDT
jgi:hypothetical protein